MALCLLQLLKLMNQLHLSWYLLLRLKPVLPRLGKYSSQM